MKTEIKTSQQALEAVLADRIADVKFWIAEGFSKEWALAKVKSETTLGEGSWAQVVAAV